MDFNKQNIIIMVITTTGREAKPPTTAVGVYIRSVRIILCMQTIIATRIIAIVLISFNWNWNYVCTFASVCI